MKQFCTGTTVGMVRDGICSQYQVRVMTSNPTAAVLVVYWYCLQRTVVLLYC